MGMHDEHNIGNLGEIRWHLCLCLLLAWVLVVLFVSRGIRSTGKVGPHPYPPSSLPPHPLTRTLPPSPPHLGAGRTVCEPRDPVHRQGGSPALPPLLTHPLTPHPTPLTPSPGCWSYCL